MTGGIKQIISTLGVIGMCFFGRTYAQERIVSPGSSTVNGYVRPSSLPSYAIDKNRWAGEFEFSSGTNQYGAKTYDIPLEVYSGNSGMTPQISLTYSSLRGSSELGVGWTINGISYITRENRSKHYDDESSGIRMNITDAFYLDGSRLIKMSENGSEVSYESEFGNIKVVAHTTGNIVNYFNVYYPDGKTALFGDVNHDTNQLYYPLTSIKDAFGNEITYSYYWTGLRYAVRGIYYNNDCSVMFNYSDTRIDPQLQFKGGVETEENRLLQSIECTYKNTVINKYSMSYDQSRGYSLLKQVERSYGNVSYNPLRFSYGDYTASFNKEFQLETERTVSAWVNDDEKKTGIVATIGKFDHDKGEDGIISFAAKYPYVEQYKKASTTSHSKKFYKNDYAEDDELIVYYNINQTGAVRNKILTVGKGFVDAFWLDVFGDGNESVVKINNYVNQNDDVLTISIYDGNRIKSNATVTTYFHSFRLGEVMKDNDSNKSVHPREFLVGDFLGNGKQQILAVSINKPLPDESRQSVCTLFDPATGEIIFSGHVFDYNAVMYGNRYKADEAKNGSDKIFAFDCDGDGKTDICLINDNSISVYNFRETDSGVSSEMISSYNSTLKKEMEYRQIMLADMNADNLADIVLSPKNNVESSNGWIACYSKGNGDFRQQSFYGPAISTKNNDELFAMDVDIDGKADLIVQRGTVVSTYLNTTNTFPTSAISKIDVPENTLLSQASVYSSHGYYNLIGLNKTSMMSYRFSRNRPLDEKLTASVSSLGLVEINNYKYIEKLESGFYESNLEDELPFLGVRERIPMLWMSMIYEKGSLAKTDQYVYEDGILNKHGLGFLGFKKISNVGVKKSSTEYDPFNYGVMTMYTDNKREQKNTYEFTRKADGTATMLQKVMNEFDKTTGNLKRYSYDYSDYGYPSKETLIYSDGVTETTTFKYKHQADISTLYLLGQASEVLHNIKDANRYFIERVLMTYNKDKLSTKRLFYQSTPTDVIANIEVRNEGYYYTSNGNRASSKINDKRDGTYEYDRYTYDEYGRESTRYDKYNNKTTTEYTSNGCPVYVTDKYGNRTQYIHNAFSELSHEILPDGVTVQHKKSWCSDDDYAVYEIETSSTDGSKSYEGYDVYGNLTRETQIDLSGERINKVTVHDVFGLTRVESLPFRGTQYKFATTYTYDSFDRLISETSPSGKIKNYTYNGNTITVDDNDRVSSITRDCRGNIIKVVDNAGGVTEFKYDLSGKKLSATTPNGFTVTYEYDSYGRQISMDDPSHGIITYAYNTDGTLLSKTDASGRATKYTYNTNKDKLTTKGSLGNVSYSYDSYGNLISKTSDNGTSVVYTLDNLGRLLTSVNTGISGKWFKKEYSYSKGNVSSVTYSSQSGILTKEQRTYTNGILTKSIINDSVDIFILNKENEFRQPTNVRTTNVNRSYTFDNYGYPKTRSYSRPLQITSPILPYNPVQKASDLTKPIIPPTGWFDDRYLNQDELQRQKYVCDTVTGLVMQRHFITETKENFTYDDYDRLISYGENTVTYDDMGNIKSLSDAVNLSYTHPSNPYAITDAFYGDCDTTAYSNRTIEYAITGLPTLIKMNGYVGTFTYNESGERVCMTITRNGKLVMTKHYLGNCYEYVETPEGKSERLYLNGDYYSASGILVKTNVSTEIFDIVRDYLGSITGIVNENHNFAQQVRYDPWGRITKVDGTEYAVGQNPDIMFERGFTGHEYLPWFGLINMNARLYDPVIGRFLSPDSELQEPENNQNYNRYSYALNNPMIYNDPDGKFFLSIFTAMTDVIGNLFKHGFNTSQYNWRKTINAWRIDAGMFKGSFGQVLNKWTWGWLNSYVGNMVGHTLNLWGTAGKVTYMDGILAISGCSSNGSAFTIGHYSFGPSRYRADWRDHLFVHEYGHYIQSQIFGSSYMFTVAPYSLISAAVKDGYHKTRWSETDASKLGMDYFDKRYGSGKKGYTKYSPDYFDKNSFKHGGYSPYINPRNKDDEYYPDNFQERDFLDFRNSNL